MKKEATMVPKHGGCFGCGSKTAATLASTSDYKRIARAAVRAGKKTGDIGCASVALCPECYGPDE